jgi:hypothetical protein
MSRAVGAEVHSSLPFFNEEQVCLRDAHHYTLSPEDKAESFRVKAMAKTQTDIPPSRRMTAKKTKSGTVLE